MSNEVSSNSYTATYSAEDNKLRLYAVKRLDEETYARAKKLGFKWAPTQDLFVAPMWTPEREDFCIELAGEIEAEQMTVVERAAAKAERLDNLVVKRINESGLYHKAADRISERFAYGQPILVGHHSERKARKDKSRMESAMNAAIRAQECAHYWAYRAEGVERHANRKSNAGVRARRIKTLLADLRGVQRGINHTHFCLQLWKKMELSVGMDGFDEKVKYYVDARTKEGALAPCYGYEESLYKRLDNGKLSSEEAVQICIEFHECELENPRVYRWINHILNRLAFERSELGDVKRFVGDITPVILQAFARENGAESPKASPVEGGYKLSSKVPLPMHIADSNELELTCDQWRDLMQSAGYEVPAAKPESAPILNFKAASLNAISYGNSIDYRQIEMTKSEYSAINKDYRGVRLSPCGTFRFRTCMHRSGGSHGLVSVFLKDSQVHPVPDSKSVCLDVEGV
jgi:Domain of unknown function (DUF3560)